MAERVAHHAGSITQVENDILALGSRDAVMGSLSEMHSDTVLDDEKFDEPLSEPKRATVRRMRESTGTHPPETTLRGDNHYEEMYTAAAFPRQ